MSRTLGFFLGSAAVFALLVYVLGQPVTLAPPLRDTETAATIQPPDAEPAAVAQSHADLVAPTSVPAVFASDDSAGIVGPPAPTPQTAAVRPTDNPDSGAPGDNDRQADEAYIEDDAVPAAPVTPTDAALTIDGQSWFPVWDPFQSELSANAFARRLERVTGLDYRVIKTGPARYRVAVAYASEEERIANVATIEEATGLSIAGGSR